MNKFTQITILAVAIGFFGEAYAFGESIIIVGQSNATGLVNYGGLSQKLGAGIIDCTHGGKPIIDFMASWDSTTFYGDCLKKVGGMKVSGIVFWQGETDSKDYVSAKNWPARARAVMAGLRNETAGIDMPIVMVALNNKPSPYKYWKAIRTFQLRMFAPNLTVIDSSPYAFKPDSVHLTPSGYDQISCKIAEIFTTRWGQL
jgi:hypothetical protein